MNMLRVVKMVNGEIQWAQPFPGDRDGLKRARDFIKGIEIGLRELGGCILGDTQYDTYLSVRDGKAVDAAMESGKMACDAPVISEFLIRADDNDPYDGPFKFSVHDCGRYEFLRNGHSEDEIV